MPDGRFESPQLMSPEIREVIERFGHREDFTGTDLAFDSGSLTLRLHLANGLPAGETLPSQIAGLPLRPVTARYFAARASCGTELMPAGRLRPGLSCGRVGAGGGVLGALVIDEETGSAGILSNAHLLAGPDAKSGDLILQPSGAEGGLPYRDGIARLNRWIFNLDGDAAVATLTGERSWAAIGSCCYSGVRSFRPGETLTMTGASAATVKAQAIAWGIYRIPFERYSGLVDSVDVAGIHLTAERTSCSDLSGAGGALWIDGDSGHAVGLHFGYGSDDQNRVQTMLACDLPHVFQHLGIRLPSKDDLLAHAHRVADVPPACVFDDRLIEDAAFV